MMGKKISFETYEGEVGEDDVEIEINLEFPSLKITVGREDIGDVLRGLGLDADFHLKYAVAKLGVHSDSFEAAMRVDNIRTLIDVYSKTQKIESGRYEVRIDGHCISEGKSKAMAGIRSLAPTCPESMAS